MRRICYLVLLVLPLLIICEGSLADIVEDEAVRLLQEHCYINPEGGSKLHLDQNCPSVSPKFLPLTEVNYDDYANSQYGLCPVCVQGESQQASQTYTFSSAVEEFKELYADYHSRPITLSTDIQVCWHDVNFRQEPGGKVIHRFLGGEVLTCLDEVQYNGNLWYHARSEQYGEGYIEGTWAKPLWHDLEFWPLPNGEDIVSRNMLFFAYWMGTYQLDHGLSIIDEDGMLSSAPDSAVNAVPSLLPDDMKEVLAEKLYEYGFICLNSSYEVLMDENVSAAEKNKLASDILMTHYGTDDLWKIIRHQSLGLFINVTDWHSVQQPSNHDRALEAAVLQILMDEHR